MYKTACAHICFSVYKNMENSGFPCDQMVELMLAVQQEMKLLRPFSKSSVEEQ